MFRNQRARTTLRNRPRGNLRVLWISTVILFGILIARLFEMQIIHGEEFSIKAENNRIVQTNIPGSRGLIYDRLGNPLVNNTVSFSASIWLSFLLCIHLLECLRDSSLTHHLHRESFYAALASLKQYYFRVICLCLKCRPAFTSCVGM